MSLRWGLIGCGDIVRKRVAAALSKGANCQLRAVSRARKELAIEFAHEYDASPFADWRQMVASSEIDAVYIATPVHLHAEQAIEAARRGKHVLCEKPMAMSAEQCDQMIAECKQAGVKLGVAYYRHFYPVIRRLRTMIESGVIGKPVLARAEAFERFDPPEGGERSWLLDPDLSGGGPMMDFGCHRIDPAAPSRPARISDGVSFEHPFFGETRRRHHDCIVPFPLRHSGCGHCESRSTPTTRQLPPLLHRWLRTH